MAIAGLFLSAGLLLADGWRLLRAGYPATAGVQILADLPLVLFFLALLAAPAVLARALSRGGARYEPSDAGHVLAGALLVVTLQFLVGRALVALALQAEGGVVGVATTRADVLASAFVLAALTVATSLAWVGFVEGRRGREMARALLLASPVRRRARDARPLRTTLLLGLGLGVAAILGALLLSWLWATWAVRAGGEPPSDEVARGIARSLGIGGILVATALSAFHEELFFRGLLAPRVGVVAQAVVFGVAHGAYGTGLQLTVTLLLGLAFGVAAMRTRSLWVPVVAHGVFNLFNLLLAAGLLGF